MLILQVGEKPCRRASDEADLFRHGVRRNRIQSGQDAPAYLAMAPYDAVLLDLDLPVLPGHELIRIVRKASPTVPIIGFTTHADVRAKVRALDMGADDVQTSFCPVEELLARVRAIQRRVEGRTQSVLRVGNLELSTDAHEISVRGVRVHFTPKEYAILEFLARKPGRPVSKGACLSYLYGGEDEPDPKILDVIICRVRKKLATAGVPHLLESVRGYGFKLSLEQTDDEPQRAVKPDRVLRGQLAPALDEVG